jgi:uncharacterized protein YndB with AHSA1/START domain
MDLGTLRELPDGWEVRYERRMAHSPAKVWRALTEPGGLRAWFPSQIEGEWTVGSTLHFTFSEPLPAEAADFEFEEADFWGEVVEVDEPHRLVYTWNKDRLTFELSDDDGGCLLVFTTVLPDRDHLCRTAAGWHECLDILQAQESEQPWELAENERWAEVHPRYEQAFGQDPQPHVLQPRDER